MAFDNGYALVIGIGTYEGLTGESYFGGDRCLTKDRLFRISRAQAK